MEAQILRALEFNINPFTINVWANLYMAEWDAYAQQNPLSLEILEEDIPGSRPLFKSDNMEDYKRFRSAFQVLDVVLLDINFVRLDKRQLVGATLYYELA